MFLLPTYVLWSSLVAAACINFYVNNKNILFTFVYSMFFSLIPTLTPLRLSFFLCNACLMHAIISSELCFCCICTSQSEGKGEQGSGGGICLVNDVSFETCKIFNFFFFVTSCRRVVLLRFATNNNNAVSHAMLLKKL